MTNQSWCEVQIEVPPEAVEVMAAIATEIAEGVELRDTGTALKSAPDRMLVIAHVAPEDREALLQAIAEGANTARAAGLTVDPLIVREREAHEDEWRDVWKQFFKTTQVGRRFIVRPSWDPVSVTDPKFVIDLDPGRAFGTGAHASTRLVIALAESLAEEAGGRPGQRVVERFLDLGCGSGILAIVAARLWPSARGLAVDVDADSVACAVENLERNRVHDRVDRGGLAGGVAGGRALRSGMANIQADVLAMVAPDLPRHLRGGAPVLLSGLLNRDAEPVAAAFTAAGFTIIERRDEGEWSGLLALAPADGAAGGAVGDVRAGTGGG